MRAKANFPEKRCKKCGEVKSLDDFHKARGCRDGHRDSCKDCIRQYKKEYREANKDSIAAKKKAYYLKNKEKVCEYQAKYRKNNPELIKRRKKEYYEKNKEQITKKTCAYVATNKDIVAERKARWKKKNAGHVNAQCMERHTKKLQRTPAWADKWTIKQYYILATKLSKMYGVKFHVDHIIPLQGKVVSGLHTHNNLRVVTQQENLTKSNRFEPTEALA